MDWLKIIRTVAPRGKPVIVQAVANAMPQIIAEFDLSSPERQSHFLAQIAHESDGFKTTVEYASGAAYEGRDGLGNTQPGDGKRFKGRGLIQLTGRTNYAAASHDLGVDFVARPEIAGQFPHAIRLAGWYWKKRNINRLADKDDIRAVTRAVNGGLNGLDQRVEYHIAAVAALKKSAAQLTDTAADAAADPPAKPKTMAQSCTGNTAIATGALGVIGIANQATSAAKEAAANASDIVTSVGPWVALGVLVIAGAAFIWFDRREKMQILGV